MRRAVWVLLAIGVVARAGPPAICWKVDIGDAKSLPWATDDSFAKDEGYDGRRAVADTLALLDAKMPVIVRMETLRRATVYLDDLPASRDALLRALNARVLDAEAAGTPSALAWFDAGYAQGCASQMSERGADGCDWVRRATELAGGSPEMEYAWGLLSLMGRHEEFLGHYEKALAGAPKNPLLAKNLERLKDLYPPVLEYWKRKGNGQGKE
jgi:hypothetical protein